MTPPKLKSILILLYSFSKVNLDIILKKLTSLCAYFPSGIIWVEGQTNPFFDGGSCYDRSQNPCRPRDGGAVPAGRYGHISVLCGIHRVRVGLHCADAALPDPVHRRADGWRDRVPRPCVPRFSLWRSCHR